MSDGYDFDPGTPGAGARREGERRRATREKRVNRPGLLDEAEATRIAHALATRFQSA